MVTMRIESVKGLPLSSLEPLLNAAANSGKPNAQRVPRWVMEREYRSTYRATLNATETIVAGSWPPKEVAPGEPVPLSLEQKLAKDLHVNVGDEIVLDVQGLPLKAKVACLRKVDWSKFNLNFFMVFPPGVLEGAPQFHLLTTRLPNEQRSGELQRALLQAAPNVSAVDLASVLATVAEQLQKAASVIQLLAGFTLAAGLPILVAALLNGKDQRIRESVLLRTLGASERQVRTIILIEYATLGLLSGLAACLLALGAHWAQARWIFKTAVPLEITPFLVALSLTLGAALTAGSFLSRGVCKHSPLAILRQG
jgi:putative ABC transport system permease protein